MSQLGLLGGSQPNGRALGRCAFELRTLKTAQLSGESVGKESLWVSQEVELSIASARSRKAPAVPMPRPRVGRREPLAQGNEVRGGLHPARVLVSLRKGHSTEP